MTRKQAVKETRRFWLSTETGELMVRIVGVDAESDVCIVCSVFGGEPMACRMAELELAWSSEAP